MSPLSCRRSYEASGSDASVLLAVVGSRRMARLQKLLGGRRIWIPKPGTRLTCLTCVVRDECIVLWRKDGRSAREIARHLGLSPKTVFHVAARAGRRRPAKRG